MARSKKIVTIDFDTWAASGGTAGIFGKNFRNGTLKIIEDEDTGIVISKKYKACVKSTKGV